VAARRARAIRATGACTVLLLLLACSATAPPAYDSGAALRHYEARRLDDPGLQQFLAQQSGPDAPAAAASWDPQRLVLAALYFHPDLPIARSQWQLARAQVLSAQAAPPVSLSAALGGATGAIGVSPWLAGAALEVLLEPGQRRQQRAERAAVLASAAQAQVQQVAWQVQEGVLGAALELWSAQGREQGLARRSQLQEQRAALFERRVSAGEAAGAQWRRELSARDQLALGLAQVRAAAAQARVRLSQAIGVPPAALAGQTLRLEQFDAAPTVPAAALDGTLLRQALQQRADVRAALAQLQAAQQDLQIELARRWPDLRLGPGYQFDLGANKYLVSLGADWPRSEGPIAEATARREQAARQLLALQARLITAVEEAAAGWRLGAAGLASADALLAAAQHREESAIGRLSAGTLDRPELLAARIDREESVQAQRDMLERSWRLQLALEEALQAPLSPAPAHAWAASADAAVAGPP